MWCKDLMQWLIQNPPKDNKKVFLLTLCYITAYYGGHLVCRQKGTLYKDLCSYTLPVLFSCMLRKVMAFGQSFHRFGVHIT